MAKTIIELMAEKLATQLRKKSLVSCSRWAQACRIMGKPFPGPWTFKHHPWLRDMHDSVSEFNVGQKAAQMGYTETALNIALYNIDIKNINVLYVLPSKTPDASEFSASRFDTALELSPYLRNLFSDVKNVGHKRAGSTNLYLRGSKSRSGLKSIPCGLIIMDEADEMAKESIRLALERSSGQFERQNWIFSTPTLPNTGVNELYESSTQDCFYFVCPHCGRWVDLIFPESLQLNETDPQHSQLICRLCKQYLEHRSKSEWLKDGRWVPTYTSRDWRGFYINQLYSATVTPGMIAQAYLKSLRDPTEEQEFYNSKLGQAHVVAGAQITISDIQACIGGYQASYIPPRTRIVTMGVDVGKWLHYEIDEWQLGKIVGDDFNTYAECKMVEHGKVIGFETLDDKIKKYGISYTVVDQNPERRAALQFANRFYGICKNCFYGNNINGKEIHESTTEPCVISVDRTAWMDLALMRFRNRTMSLPYNVDEEYKNHITVPARVYQRDVNGNPVGSWDSGVKDDHYAHARTYSEIAFSLAAKFVAPRNIASPI